MSTRLLNRFLSLAGLMLLVVIVAACAPALAADSAAQAGAGLRQIAVENVSVEVGVGSPIPVQVVASGTWPDLCAQLAETRQTVSASAIEITLLASAADPACPPDYVGVSFYQSVTLNTANLPTGMYTVSVNGVSVPFDWQGGANVPTVAVMDAVLVDEVNIEVEGGGAVKNVTAIVSGRLLEVCDQIDEVTLARDGTTFNIVVLTERDYSQECAADGGVFRVAVPLNLTGLPADTYTVNANGVTATFDPRTAPVNGR